MNPQPDDKWQVRLVRPGLPGLDRLPELGLPDLSRLPWMNHPIRPADIDGALRDAMLARENLLEDVNYQKVVPNHFIVEVSDENYARQYRPIERQITQQWREHLMEELVTANSRRGRKEYHFGGRLLIEVRPAAELRHIEARILSRIEPDALPGGQNAQPARANRPDVFPAPRVTPPPAARPFAPPPLRQGGPPTTVPDRPAVRPSGRRVPPPGDGEPGQGLSAFVELVPTGQRWALYPGINTIGRSETCQIFLDMPVVQEKRLVSGQHAYIMFQNGKCILYDGAPDGRPSANGTYVNLRRVPPTGYQLQNGDAIVLAAIDPLYPRSDTPGVVTLYFWINR